MGDEKKVKTDCNTKEEDNSDLEIFFKFLAIRLYNEPYISDITWALINAVHEFKSFIFNFFFNEDNIGTKAITREYRQNNSQPDFFIKDIDNNEYLIEIKKYDRNYHFEQYKNEFPDAKKAFIAIYDYKENVDDWRITTWSNFIQELEEKQINNNLVQAYLEYIKKTTDYVEVKKMNLENSQSLFNFYNCILEVTKKFGYEEYNAPSRFSKNQYGTYVYDSRNLYLWFGLWIDKDKIAIYINFHQIRDTSWVPSKIANKLLTINSDGKFYDSPTEEENGLWFKLKDDYFEKLCKNDIDVDEQKKILSDFFEEIISLTK